MVGLYSGRDEAQLCEFGDISPSRVRSPDRLLQQTLWDQMDGWRKK